jgi:hypothetical protein
MCEKRWPWECLVKCVRIPIVQELAFEFFIKSRFSLRVHRKLTVRRLLLLTLLRVLDLTLQKRLLVRWNLLHRGNQKYNGLGWAVFW